MAIRLTSCFHLSRIPGDPSIGIRSRPFGTQMLSAGPQFLLFLLFLLRINVSNPHTKPTDPCSWEPQNQEAIFSANTGLYTQAKGAAPVPALQVRLSEERALVNERAKRVPPGRGGHFLHAKNEDTNAK